MKPRGLADIAIVGVGLTPQRRRHDRTSLHVALDAAKLALADAGLERHDLDGIAARWPGPGGTVLAPGSADWSGLLEVPVNWIGDSYPQGVPALLDAAGAILAGQCETVLITGGQAGVLGGGRVAAYTQPGNEFVAPFGAFTAAHFALVAQRHLHRFPDVRQGAAEIAAAIRTTGSSNPDAILGARGPVSAEDVLAAAPLVDPFTVMDVCLASEGGAAIVVTTLERARDLRHKPVVVLGGGMEWLRQQYVDPARYDEVWSLGRSAADRAFRTAGLTPSDVDTAQLYDVTSFEVARQFEILGFCETGSGAEFAAEVGIDRLGKLPTCTDGGLMSFSHIGWGAPTLKLIEAVRQLRGTCGDRQVPRAEIALAAGAGSAAQYYNLVLLGAGS